MKKHGSEPLSCWDLTTPKEHDKYCEVIVLSKSHYIVADCFGPPRYDPVPGGASTNKKDNKNAASSVVPPPQNKPVKKRKVISLSVSESAEASCPKSSQPRKKVLRPVGNAKRGEGPNLSDAVVGSKGSIPCDSQKRPRLGTVQLISFLLDLSRWSPPLTTGPPELQCFNIIVD